MMTLFFLSKQVSYLLSKLTFAQKVWIGVILYFILMTISVTILGQAGLFDKMNSINAGF